MKNNVTFFPGRCCKIALSVTLALGSWVAHAQNQTVSLSTQKMSYKELFRNIEKQTQMSVDYNNNLIDVNKQVNLQSKSGSLADILTEGFKGTGIAFRIENNHIILYHPAKEKTPAQEARIITGAVTDVQGVPVIGANVIEKHNPKNGCITDVDGNFSLNAAPGSTLLISYIGFNPQEVAVGSNSSYKVTLKEDLQNLDEVVVVGYGVQKKVNMTGSVSAVNGEELSKRPVSNATQSLQGMVPGLLVTNSNTGRPGADGTLSLRGQGNLANTASPYVLVDGVEMSLSDVNPNDIESISVLKDAAACSIYGARAAYGVILVTTKRGEDGKMRVNYQGTVGWSSPTVLPDMANSYDFARYFNEGCKNAGVAEQYSAEKLALLQQYVQNPAGIDCWSELTGNNLNAAFENTANGVGNVDYFKLHYKENAFKQNHNISMSGGGKRAQYYVSGGAYTEDGLLRYADMDFKRFNFNANINSQITDWLNMKVNTKYVHSDQDTPFGTGALSEGFYHSLARFRPTVSERDPNGNFTELTMIPYLQSGTYTDKSRDNVTLTGILDVQPLKDWHIFMEYTYKHGNQKYEALNVAPMIPGRDGETLYKGTRSELGIAENGMFTRTMSQSNYQAINLYSNYLLSIADAHNFVFMAGYQEDKYTYSYMFNQVKDLISTTNPGLSLATGTQTLSETRNGWATRGFFGRINYDYKGRYLLEVNGRYDGSSRFASNHRWGFFPSVSVGWNMMRESFMQSASTVLSNLKLRGSYGLLGNQNGADLYTFASIMETKTQGNYYFSDGRQMYIKAPGVIDPNTTWEKVKSANVGIDFGFFGNSLTGTFDIFQRDTRDMLGPTADFADLFGADAPNTNNACMRNRGWELSLMYRGRIGSDITYSVNGSVSDATSKVTKYENPTGTDPAGKWYKGRMVGEIWGYRASGLIQNQAEADDYNSRYNLSYLSGQKWTPGDVKYLDINNDGKIDNGKNILKEMGDVSIIGNTTPRYQYTFGGLISWKGVSLNVLFQGVGKRDWAPGSGSVYFWGSGPYAQVTVFNDHLDYWTEENTNAYYPKPYTAGAGAIAKFRNKTSQVCDRYLQNAAYLRLKNLTVSYELPQPWMNKIGLSKTQVFFSGENLLTFTKLASMFDPEAIFTENSYTSEGGKNYPINRVLSVGLIINL